MWLNEVGAVSGKTRVPGENFCFIYLAFRHQIPHKQDQQRLIYSVMKINVLPCLAALFGPVFMLSTLTAAEPGKEDLGKVYEAGRQAFNKGDLTTARIAFLKVLKAKPDFDLANIYMAQIRSAEAKWEARPRSLKIAETAPSVTLTLSEVSVSDALELVRRELEKAGGGPAAGKITLLARLPEDSANRIVDLSVKDMPMIDFIDAVAFAGDLNIAWHAEGLLVNPDASSLVPEPAAEVQIKRMKQLAKDTIIPTIKFSNLSTAEAWTRLGRLASTSGAAGFHMIVREPSPESVVNLDLRQIPLSEAIRLLGLVCGTQVAWQPWGAGIYSNHSLASVGPP